MRIHTPWRTVAAAGLLALGGLAIVACGGTSATEEPSSSTTPGTAVAVPDTIASSTTTSTAPTTTEPPPAAGSSPAPASATPSASGDAAADGSGGASGPTGRDDAVTEPAGGGLPMPDEAPRSAGQTVDGGTFVLPPPSSSGPPSQTCDASGCREQGGNVTSPGDTATTLPSP